jgi:hypothetical protein
VRETASPLAFGLKILELDALKLKSNTEMTRKKVLVSLRGRGKGLFIEMDNFQRWVAGRDVHLVKWIGILGLMNIVKFNLSLCQKLFVSHRSVQLET